MRERAHVCARTTDTRVLPAGRSLPPLQGVFRLFHPWLPRMLLRRLATRRALSTSVAVPTTPPAITSRVQQIFEDHSATSGLADNDTKFKASTAC
eukprot:scaffold2156_cov67-Phaeocystis_antarctica.AAC.1